MLKKAIIFLYVFCISFWLSSFFNHRFWLAEILINFLPFFGFGFLIAGFFWLFKSKRKFIALFAFVPAIITLSEVYSVYLPQSGSENVGRNELSVLSVNLWSANRSHDRVLNLIKAKNADLVLVMELTPSWHDALQSIKSNYPHFHEIVREDNFGIALYSKLPLSNIQSPVWSESTYPSILADLKVNDFQFSFIGTHPMPPKHPTGYKYRNTHFEKLIDEIRQKNNPVLLFGDLNVSPYSKWFKRILDETALIDSRQGFGIHATWPAQTHPFSFPIDHGLYSPEFKPIERSNNPKIGSDHMPVFVKFNF